LLLIVLVFAVIIGYQVLFNEKKLDEVGKIISFETKKLQAKGAEEILDFWLKENISNIRYDDIKCFEDEEYGLACTINRLYKKKGNDIFSSDSITIYGITEIGLKGFDVTSGYLNTKIKLKAYGLKIPNGISLNEDLRDIFTNASLIEFELNNYVPSTGTVEFKSQIKFKSQSINKDQHLNFNLNTYGEKHLIKNVKSFYDFYKIIDTLNLDSLDIKLKENDSQKLNLLLFKFIKNNDTSYRDLIKTEGNEKIAYYTLMTSLSKDIHKNVAKNIADFLSFRSSTLNLEIKSKLYDDIKLKKILSDFKDKKLNSNLNIEIK